MKQHPIWNALSHAAVIGSAMFFIFFLIDCINPPMDFLGSTFGRWCLFFYCIISMASAICSAVYIFRRRRAAEKRSHAQR